MAAAQRAASERVACQMKLDAARMVRKLVQLGDHARALGAQAELARRKLEAWTAR